MGITIHQKALVPLRIKEKRRKRLETGEIEAIQEPIYDTHTGAGPFVSYLRRCSDTLCIFDL